MRALALHTTDIWPILAIAVILGLPIAGYLLQVSRVRRARLAAARLAASRPATGRILIRLDHDLAHVRQADLADAARSSLAEILGTAAAGWTVDFGPPSTGRPRVVVEITAPGDPPPGLTTTVHTDLARLLPIDPDDIDVQVPTTPA